MMLVFNLFKYLKNPAQPILEALDKDSSPKDDAWDSVSIVSLPEKERDVLQSTLTQSTGPVQQPVGRGLWASEAAVLSGPHGAQDSMLLLQKDPLVPRGRQWVSWVRQAFLFFPKLKFSKSYMFLEWFYRDSPAKLRFLLNTKKAHHCLLAKRLQHASDILFSIGWTRQSGDPILALTLAGHITCSSLSQQGTLSLHVQPPSLKCD